jgi:hypothetical protein
MQIITYTLDGIIKNFNRIMFDLTDTYLQYFAYCDFWMLLFFHSRVVPLSSGSFELSLNDTFFSGST